MKTAFIGDIHGCDRELSDVLGNLEPDVERVVFLGDYVDRGPHSKQVLNRLIELKRTAQREVVFLAGNHDRMLLRVLNDDLALTTFLKMGGAATIRSYVAPPYQDVLSQLRAAFPIDHRQFLEDLRPSWSDKVVFATHDESDFDYGSAYLVAGHSVRTDLLPRVESGRAFIDTGCGTSPGGRLTCFLWPSRNWYQSRELGT